MLRRLVQTIEERGLIRRGQRIVAACSGGADSVALLHALWFLRDRIGFHVDAAHLHHGLRGAEADADEALVTEWCARRGIPLLVGHASVRDWQSAHGGSLEMAARSVRHQFLRDAMKHFRADGIALAHHQGDQAETVLMRLLSGSGMDGLGGMDYRAEPAPGLVVIRPMLDVSREAVVAFLRRHRLAWREDASNRDVSILRNRVRLELLPAIAAAGFPGAVPALARFADLMREEARLAEGRVRRLQVPFVPAPLPLRLLRRRAVAEQRRILRAWLGAGGPLRRDLDFERLEQVRALADGRRSQPVAVGGDLVVVADVTCLRTQTNAAGSGRRGKPSAPAPVPLVVPGVTEVPGMGWRITVTPAEGYVPEPVAVGILPAVGYLRRDPGAPPALMVRTRRPGDRIAPTGMAGTVSVKQLMIDRKIPAARRDAIPLVCAGAEVLWVAGYRVARPWSVSGPSSPSWRLRIEQIPAGQRLSPAPTDKKA